MSQKWWYCVTGFLDSLGTYANKKPIVEPTEEEAAELEVLLCKRSRKEIHLREHYITYYYLVITFKHVYHLNNK